MGKKHLSLIIVPHTKSGFRTLSFSKRTINAVKWIAILVVVIGLGVTADYIRIQVKGREYKNLAAENAKQRETLANYESTLGTLQKRILAFDDYVKKLNLMAGIKSPDVLKEVGIGGGGYTPDSGQTIPGLPPAIGSGNLKNIQQKTEDIQKNLDSLVGFFQNQENRLASTPTIYPTVGLLTSQFGWRPDPFTRKQTFHYGIDIASALGNPIVATADGVVIAINSDKLFGLSVQINHGLGYTTIYGHMSAFKCRIGQRVKRGDVIGEVGQTGKALGPHVHYEIRLNGTSVNPYLFILEE
ncbi:MAG: M23 family metallopeptidase [Candidatus Aminicenantes bacterium]|nr:M23 family metallopeptidase [Candidatus Aminicenantes bacterium]